MKRLMRDACQASRMPRVEGRAGCRFGGRRLWQPPHRDCCGPTTQLAHQQRGMARRQDAWLRAGALLTALAASACNTVSSVTDTLLGSAAAPAEGQPRAMSQGFLGGAVADEPRAALAAREVLSAGGTRGRCGGGARVPALAVTLPSRAGLGGGGACIAYARRHRSRPTAVCRKRCSSPRSPPPRPARRRSAGGCADAGARAVPAACPLRLAAVRGPGRRRPSSWPASARRRSRALVRTSRWSPGPLLADPNARAVFTQNGAPLAEGQTLLQPDLGCDAGADPGRRRGRPLHRRAGEPDRSGLAAGRRADHAGGSARRAAALGACDRAAAYGNDKVAFLPPPADGGLAAAAAFAVLSATHRPGRRHGAGPGGRRALAGRRRRRAGAAGHVATCRRRRAAAARPPPASPRSTRTATRWPARSAWTICSAPGASCRGWASCSPPRPLPCRRRCMSAAIAWNDNIHAFRAEVAGSGQAGAPLAVAVGMMNALRTNQPMAGRCPIRAAPTSSPAPLPAGRERLLRLGQRSARSRAGGRRRTDAFGAL